MVALEDLVVDSRELDRELVATVLAPYLRIDRRSGEVIPLGLWEETPTESRVLLYLLARRAMQALALPGGDAAATPVEIERATGIPGGSVRPALRRLLKSRAVARGDGASYIVPNYAMARVHQQLRPWSTRGVA